MIYSSEVAINFVNNIPIFFIRQNVSKSVEKNNNEMKDLLLAA